MSFLASHLGDDTSTSANPTPAVIDTSMLLPAAPIPPATTNLSLPPDVLPTNGVQPLATSSAQPVPTSPASPMQASPPDALAVMDPNAYQPPLPPTAIVQRQGMSNGMKIGLAVLGIGAYLYFKGKR